MRAVTFRPFAGQIYMRTARLNEDAVRELLALFGREQAWPLFDELQAAVDGVELEVAT